MIPSSSKYEAALTIRPGTSKKDQLGHGYQAWDARPRPGLKFLAKDHRFGAFNWYALTQRLGGLKKKDLQQNCKRQMANGCTQWIKILSQGAFLYYHAKAVTKYEGPKNFPAAPFFGPFLFWPDFSTQRCVLPVSKSTKRKLEICIFRNGSTQLSCM